MSADDVKYSFERAIHNPLPSAAPNLLTLEGVDITTPITVIDTLHAKLNTTEHTAFLMRILPYLYFGILDSKEALANATAADPWSDVWLATHTDGYGAYYAKGMQSGIALDLEANPNFSLGPAPYFRTIIVKTIADASVRQQLIQTGYASFTTGLTWPQFASLRSDKNLTTTTLPSTGQDTLYLDCKKVVALCDPRVREAINLAIDRKAIATSIYRGFLKPATYLFNAAMQIPSPVPTLVQGPDVPGAKALLAAAGYPNGFSLTISATPATTGDYIGDLITLVQAQLAPIGIQVSADIQSSPATYAANRNSWKNDADIHRVTSVVPNAFYDMRTIYGNLNTPNAMGTLYLYRNTQLQQVIFPRASSIGNGPRFNRLWVSAYKMLNNDMVRIPLVDARIGVVFDKTITGMLDYPGYPPMYQYLHR
jgi:peptide/nickel transport system substrate-binding protein